MAKSWRDRYCNENKGICDFSLNYDFFFKWLLNKVMSCIVIDGGDSTKVNKNYLKMNLLLDGIISITDFDEDLYACTGNLGGEPDEYYVPTSFIIANPILGSKTVYWRDFKNHKKNGVLICNTSIDKFIQGVQDCGLFKLIHQTATLLADNIVSINSCQINTRVVAIVTAESQAQAATAEGTMKEIYAGAPFKVLRSDMVKKITVSPLANASTSSNITELVELHNYIIGNFFQSIGIKANNVRKKERLITDEINSQDPFVALSMTELLESWTRGFDEVNEMYGTDFSVKLNPVLAPTLIESVLMDVSESDSEPISEGVVDDAIPTQESDESAAESEDQTAESNAESAEDTPEDNPEVEQESLADQVESAVEDASEAVEAIADALTGDSESDAGDEEEGDGDTHDPSEDENAED